MTRAAGIFLLLAVTFDIFDGNQYLIHRHAEEIPERVEVIYSRKALAVLPFIDGAGLLKAEIALDVPNRQPAFDAQAADIVSRCREVDDLEKLRVHMNTSLKSDTIR